MVYTVSRQLQFPDGGLMVEISFGGSDYTNPDAFMPKYDGEGVEYDLATDAVAAAVDIRAKWAADAPDEIIEIGSGATCGMTCPFDSSAEKELLKWAKDTDKDQGRAEAESEIDDDYYDVYSNDFDPIDETTFDGDF